MCFFWFLQNEISLCHWISLKLPSKCHLYPFIFFFPIQPFFSPPLAPTPDASPLGCPNAAASPPSLVVPNTKERKKLIKSAVEMSYYGQQQTPVGIPHRKVIRGKDPYPQSGYPPAGTNRQHRGTLRRATRRRTRRRRNRRSSTRAAGPPSWRDGCCKSKELPHNPWFQQELDQSPCPEETIQPQWWLDQLFEALGPLRRLLPSRRARSEEDEWSHSPPLRKMRKLRKTRKAMKFGEENRELCDRDSGVKYMQKISLNRLKAIKYMVKYRRIIIFSNPMQK